MKKPTKTKKPTESGKAQPGNRWRLQDAKALLSEIAQISPKFGLIALIERHADPSLYAI
jgi:hypothetical protein